MSVEPVLGIVVPTLNESGELPSLLDDLERLAIPHRVIVVDGGSVDGTVETARSRGVSIHRAPRGRASQLNAGARRLDTPWLLFLHADVRLRKDARTALEKWLPQAEPDEVAFFRLHLAGEHWFYRIAEGAQRLRERLTGLVYGDQGLVLHRSLYESVGGFPSLPLMEDVEIVRSLRRRASLQRLPAALVSSPRRYEREGRWLAWLRNGLLLTLHLAGVPTRILARWYRPEPHPGGRPEARRSAPPRSDDPGTHGPAPGAEKKEVVEEPISRTGQEEDHILLVFAKAPVEGRVKTRLARSIGEGRATRLYRELGRTVVDQLRDGPYRVVVCHDPPDARNAVRAWLGSTGLTFRPQRGAGLGQRMAEALAWALAQATRACIVGTDAPDVGRGMVEEAFSLLDEADVVLGPATDGGYYLLALSEPRPEIFRDVEWSTPTVLDRTLERARELGLTVRLLAERTDLDTVEDLERLGLDRA